MALTEQRRSQLDGIVQKMLQNKESDSNIQFVVDDFKKKYEGESIQNTPAPQTEQPGMLKSIGQGISDFTIGVGKGALSTVKGMANIGEKGLNTIDNLTGQHGLSQMAGLKPGETATDKIIPENLTEATNTAQSLGKGVEQIAEFLIPGGASAKAGKLVEGASFLSKTPKLAKTLSLGTRVVGEAGLVGGQTALQQGKIDDKAKVNAIVAGLFPIAGAALGSAKPFLGKVGEKIEQSVIKPSQVDITDGFNIKNLRKYNVGGSLKDIIANTHTKLNELGQQLKSKLASNNTSINLNKVFEETADDLLKNKGINFGNVAAIKNVLENQLKNEILEQAGSNGLVDLVEANVIKRGAGTKGAWAFNRPEPDATAIEKVYTTFYNKLKTTIENNAPDGVKELNKQMSELIPISNAALRRLPVDQRNNMIGLTDNINLFSVMLDPKALALLGANKLAKSGQFGNYLMKVAENAKKPSATTVGQRIFGK